MTTTEPIVLRKPTFITVDKLEPLSKGVNLYAKVVNLNVIVEKTRFDGEKTTIGEALIADKTGCVLLTLRNEQIKSVKVDDLIVVRNAKVNMIKSHMRVSVDQWGLIEQLGTKDPIRSKLEAVNIENNLSLVEYELVGNN